ncbi:response regulator [Candidatus Protochlamydia phocaeensis]|uniref:response regulator n=1 Tax=Candidatus Protochlamydia phocaeensis TaxID=1414722 RepID=UPI000838ACFD|nr:response regulator [Candidatus Protochlamydia phocaeensis]
MNKNCLKILIVDSEEDSHLLFNQQFKNEIKANQLSLYYAHSSEEALSYLSKNLNPRLVFILADISMLGINGFELLKIIKQQYPHLPIYMAIANENPESGKLAKEFGAEEILSKPLNFAYLKKMILNFIERHESN